MPLPSEKTRDHQTKEIRNERIRFMGSSEDRFQNLEELYWKEPNSSKGKIARRVGGKEKHDIHSDTGL